MFPMDTGGPCCSRACVATTSAASCTHNHACYMPLPPILNSMEMFKLFVMCESTCVVQFWPVVLQEQLKHRDRCVTSVEKELLQVGKELLQGRRLIDVSLRHCLPVVLCHDNTAHKCFTKVLSLTFPESNKYYLQLEQVPLLALAVPLVRWRTMPTGKLQNCNSRHQEKASSWDGWFRREMAFF